MESPQVGDIGTMLKVTVNDDGTALDISGATVKLIILRSPKGVGKIKTAAFFTTGADGILKYVTVANDLDEAGTWQLQAKVTLTDGTWHSNVAYFDVLPNLD